MQCVCSCSCVELRWSVGAHATTKITEKSDWPRKRKKFFLRTTLPFSIFACVLWAMYITKLCVFMNLLWLANKTSFLRGLWNRVEYKSAYYYFKRTLYLRVALVFSFAKYIANTEDGCNIFLLYQFEWEQEEKMRTVRKTLWSTSDILFIMASFLTSLFLLPFELFLDHITTTT